MKRCEVRMHGRSAPPAAVPTFLGLARQLGDDICHSRHIGGKGLGLEAENELTLGEEAPTLTGGSIVPLGWW